MTAVDEAPVTEAAEPEPVLISEPGVYELDEATYFADPVPGRSLSVSGAKRILPPSCPAIFRWEQLNGRPSKPAFDFGHAAHLTVLGAGAPLVVVAADNWLTKAAKEQRAEAHAAGHTPILTREHEQVLAMATVLREHPIASVLFDPEHGRAEQSMFAVDQWHGVMRRSRLDWLPDTRPDGRLILPDYKTAVSAEPRAFAKSAANFGYPMQDAWYSDLARDLELAEDVAFVFVVQEKTPPFVVTVVELDAEARRIGRERNQRALEIYAECATTDTWPGYSDDVELVSLPQWALYDHDREFSA